VLVQNQNAAAIVGETLLQIAHEMLKFLQFAANVEIAFEFLVRGSPECVLMAAL
jgi:hypothetical protein